MDPVGPVICWALAWGAFPNGATFAGMVDAGVVAGVADIALGGFESGWSQAPGMGDLDDACWPAGAWWTAGHWLPRPDRSLNLSPR